MLDNAERQYDDLGNCELEVNRSWGTLHPKHVQALEPVNVGL